MEVTPQAHPVGSAGHLSALKRPYGMAPDPADTPSEGKGRGRLGTDAGGGRRVYCWHWRGSLSWPRATCPERCRQPRGTWTLREPQGNIPAATQSGAGAPRPSAGTGCRRSNTSEGGGIPETGQQPGTEAAAEEPHGGLAGALTKASAAAAAGKGGQHLCHQEDQRCPPAGLPGAGSPQASGQRGSHCCPALVLCRRGQFSAAHTSACSSEPQEGRPRRPAPGLRRPLLSFPGNGCRKWGVPSAAPPDAEPAAAG